MIGPAGFMAAPKVERATDAQRRVERLVSGAPPMCHFTPMGYAWADDWPNGQVEFWECRHCGHTKEINRTYPAC